MPHRNRLPSSGRPRAITQRDLRDLDEQRNDGADDPGTFHSTPPGSTHTPHPIAEIPPDPPRVIMRLKEVLQRTGLSRSTIYDRLNPKSKRWDPHFPPPISLRSPPSRHRSAVGWFKHEIEAWLARCGTARGR